MFKGANKTLEGVYGNITLVAEFISPPKAYTFSFIVGKIIPKRAR